jgi:hypothetical protein
MTERDFAKAAGVPPHPRPLSRKGRGEKIGMKRLLTLLPSPLAGEGVGGEGGPGVGVPKSRTRI